MFLVRSAADVMDTDVILVDEAARFTDILRLTEDAGGLRHLVITRGNLIVGVLRVNTRLRQTVSAAAADVLMGSLAQRNFTIVRRDAVMFDVIARLWRRHAAMGIVVDGRRRLPRVDDVVGVITREHVADEVARSVRVYTR